MAERTSMRACTVVRREDIAYKYDTALQEPELQCCIFSCNGLSDKRFVLVAFGRVHVVLLIELHLLSLLQEEAVAFQGGVDLVDITVYQVGVCYVIKARVCDLECALCLSDIVKQHIARRARLYFCIYDSIKYALTLIHISEPTRQYS